MRALIALLILFMSAHAQAGVMGALGLNLAFEYNGDGRTLETRVPVMVRGGYAFSQFDAYLQYETFGASSGTQLVKITRTRHEFTAWARKVFVPQMLVAPYVAGGAGFNYETIETSLGSQSVKDSGAPQTVLAAATGARLLVNVVELALEARVGTAPNYDPNPMFALGFLLGVSFK